jgi:hypothetical protein
MISRGRSWSRMGVPNGAAVVLYICQSITEHFSCLIDAVKPRVWRYNLAKEKRRLLKFHCSESSWVIRNREMFPELRYNELFRPRSSLNQCLTLTWDISIAHVLSTRTLCCHCTVHILFNGLAHRKPATVVRSTAVVLHICRTITWQLILN